MKNIENDRVHDALVETRANEVIKYLAKLNVTEGEARDVLWRAESIMSRKAREVSLSEIIKKLSDKTEE